MGATAVANLNTDEYVKIGTANGGYIIQSHRDTVRITFSDVKPALSNIAFHELGGAGKESILNVSSADADVWALAMTVMSKLTITKINESLPVSIKINESLPVSITEPLEPNGSVPVTIQDQTTPVVIVPLHQLKNATTLATDAVIDTYSVNVTDTTGFTDGSLIVISDIDSSQVYIGKQVGAPVGNTINVDRPFDFTFVTGKYVTSNTDNMNVDGSVTTQAFGLRQGLQTGLDLTVDVVRVLPIMYTDSAPTISDFGDIPNGLTYGVTLRKRDGNRVNIFNIKDNGDFASLAYDLEFLSAVGQGQDGLHGRLTFGGQSKMGVVVRVPPNEDLEMLINDDLTDLDKFNLIAEGSLVID